MALFGRLTGRTCSQLRQCRAFSNQSTCSFAARQIIHFPVPREPKFVGASWKQVRALSTSQVLFASSQEAPSAQAYLQSGAIAGGRNLVDVKKVLVIGSGGLSIGQAGEFDYSGEYRSTRSTLYLKLCNLTVTSTLLLLLLSYIPNNQ